MPRKPKVVRPVGRPRKENLTPCPKRGMGSLILTQRPAFVSKYAISQCPNRIIGRIGSTNKARGMDQAVKG